MRFGTLATMWLTWVKVCNCEMQKLRFKCSVCQISAIALTDMKGPWQGMLGAKVGKHRHVVGEILQKCKTPPTRLHKSLLYQYV